MALVSETPDDEVSFASGSKVNVVTNDDGTAVFDDLIVEKAGTYRLRFSVDGSEDVEKTSEKFTVAEGD